MTNRATWMARAAGTVFVLVLILTLLQAASIVAMGRIDNWSILLPMPFYLFAMAATWWSLRMIGKGASLAPQLSLLMRRAGVALFIGGLVEVFGTNAYLSATGAAGQPINVTAIVIGVIGVGLYGLSALIEEARAARAELEEFV